MSEDWDELVLSAQAPAQELEKHEPVTELVALSQAPWMCESCGRFYAQGTMCAVCENEVLLDLREDRFADMVMQGDERRQTRRFNRWLVLCVATCVVMGLPGVLILVFGVSYWFVDRMLGWEAGPMADSIFILGLVAYPMVSVIGTVVGYHLLERIKPVRQLGASLAARIELDEGSSSARVARYEPVVSKSLMLAPGAMFKGVGAVIYFSIWLVLGAMVENALHIRRFMGYDLQGYLALSFLLPACFTWWLMMKFMKSRERRRLQ